LENDGRSEVGTRFGVLAHQRTEPLAAPDRPNDVVGDQPNLGVGPRLFGHGGSFRDATACLPPDVAWACRSVPPSVPPCAVRKVTTSKGGSEPIAPTSKSPAKESVAQIVATAAPSDESALVLEELSREMPARRLVVNLDGILSIK
jgi:hypothetical protein